MKISIIIPVYNEQDSVKPLIKQLIDLQQEITGKTMEIIFVDDGSNDDSNLIINKEIFNRPNMKIIGLTRNFGQTAAISAGIDHAKGECS